MSKTGNRKSLKQRIAKFRLAAATVILGNLAYTAHLTNDIDRESHIAELCEQYTLLLLLNALATKCGFPVCTDNMLWDKHVTGFPLLSWASLADLYPLQIQSEITHLEEMNASLNDSIQLLEPLEPELIGAVYQQTISAPLSISNDGTVHIDMHSDGRTGGEFYTPAWVADYAMEKWFEADSASILNGIQKNAEYPRILDPSCGTGNFLLAAARYASKLSLSASQYWAFVENSLHGKDIDGKAVQICKILILILAAPQLLKLAKEETKWTLSSHAFETLLNRLDNNIRITDSLLLSLNDRNSAEHFDLVITNPPYISFGSRDQQHLTMQWQHLLKRRFPSSSEYKIRYTSIFQEIGIGLACRNARRTLHNRPFKGQCIFLVPDAFLTGSFYQKLRSLILDNVDIQGLSELPASTIGDATVGRWCLAHYTESKSGTSGGAVPGSSEGTGLSTLAGQRIASPLQKHVDNRFDREGSPPGEAAKIVNVYSVSSGPEGAISAKFEMPYAGLVGNDRKRFQIVFTNDDLEILLLCKEYGFLGTRVSGHTGIRARNGQSTIISLNKASEQHAQGLISGGELRPFQIEWRKNWLEIQPKKLFAGGFDKNIICGPKLLLRQTGDSIVAAVDYSGLYHLNNVHSFVPIAKGERENRLNFFCCLLNSSFYLYYYRLKTREHKRALAQIDIETVEHMPLPHRNERIEEALETIGAELSSTCLNDSSSQDRSKNFLKLDELVFEMFGLTDQMQLHVLESVGKPRAGLPMSTATHI